MIKVLHIIPSLGKGGAERLVLDICNALAKRSDVKVMLVVFAPVFSFPEIRFDFEIKLIPSRVQLSIWKENMLSVGELQNLMDAFKPDVIHSHLFEAEVVSRSCNYKKAKWFSHCHDNMPQFKKFSLKTLFNKRQLTNFYEKRYLFSRYKKNGGNKFIAISEHSKAYYIQTATPWPVKLLHNSIDYEKFALNREGHCGNAKPNFICIGSLVENKNQIFLVEVSHCLKRRGFEFEMHFLGDGPSRDKVMRRIIELDLQKDIFLHGNVDHVQEYLWNSNLYLHVAKSESFGLAILEAMAVGLPVVCLDGGGNRDIIEDGKNGFILAEQNAECFANKIIQIIETPELYQQMSAYAREYAKRYDIRDYVDNLLKIYKSA